MQTTLKTIRSIKLEGFEVAASGESPVAAANASDSGDKDSFVAVFLCSSWHYPSPRSRTLRENRTQQKSSLDFIRIRFGPRAVDLSVYCDIYKALEHFTSKHHSNGQNTEIQPNLPYLVSFLLWQMKAMSKIWVLVLRSPKSRENARILSERWCVRVLGLSGTVGDDSKGTNCLKELVVEVAGLIFASNWKKWRKICTTRYSGNQFLELERPVASDHWDCEAFERRISVPVTGFNAP
ncbi:hypothetical protein B0H14DRAFT_2614997 [Mycena olivaceomarginata]|nr:hypothetical protein B0H14DRAFT_2614997 [Mycena olivaceomarginata]